MYVDMQIKKEQNCMKYEMKDGIAFRKLYILRNLLKNIH